MTLYHDDKLGRVHIKWAVENPNEAQKLEWFIEERDWADKRITAYIDNLLEKETSCP